MILSNSMDDCGAPLTISNDWDGSSVPTQDCMGSTGLLITFTVVDECSNATDCSAQVIIQDNNPPVINCVATDLILECDQDYVSEINTWITNTEALILSNSMDDCGAPLTISNDWDGSSVPTQDCMGSTGLTITFTVVDECNNATDCSAQVIIQDNNPPVINCVATDLILECDQDYVSEINTWITNTEALILSNSMDDCGAPLTISNDWDGSSVPTQDCMGSTGLTITFTVVDECNNATDCSAQVIIQDNNPPVINCVATDLILECDQDYVSEINTWITNTEALILSNSMDDCGAPLTISNDWDGSSVPTQDCMGSTGLTITFTVVDECNNATDCSAQVIIQDNNPPVINCVATDLILECDQDYVSEINTWITNTEAMILSNSMDDCGAPLTISNDWDGSSVPTQDCMGSTGLTITFTVVDECNNATDCSAQVIIQDNNPPVINCVATDLILECDQDYVSEINTWITNTEALILSNSMDDCGAPLTISNDWDGSSVPTQDCMGSTGLTITFTVVDECNNATDCSAQVIIQDNNPPVINCVATDLILECDQDYVSEISTWITNTEALILSNSMDDCGAPLTISNDWDGSSVPTQDCNGQHGSDDHLHSSR